MMPQMESSEPIREQPRATYRGYEGNPEYAQPQQEIPSYNPPPQNASYDDNFVEAVAQRLVQRMGQGPAEKIHTPVRSKESMGQRLALAIVSVVMLVPLAGILMSGVGGVGGLIAFGAVCLAIFLINAVFNEYASK